MISVTEPIPRALARTREILFAPFRFEKWLALGFCAFLAHLGGGGLGNLNFRGNPLSQARPDLSFDALGTWVSNHLPLIWTLGLALLGMVLILSLLFMWLGSRGQFMFLDGIVHNRGEVVEPWRGFRNLANDLTVFRILLGLAGLLVLGAIGFLGWSIARPDIAAARFGPAALSAALISGVLLLVTLVPLGLVGLLLTDFVVPIMYRRGLRTGEAFGVLWRELIPGQGWTFVLFYLLRLGMGIGAALLVMVGTCLTCCLAALPYVSSVVFLPILVFFRCYTLCFLEQFGEEWQLSGKAEG